MKRPSRVRGRLLVALAATLALLPAAGPRAGAFDRPSAVALRGAGEVATGQQLGPTHSGEAKTAVTPPLRT